MAVLSSLLTVDDAEDDDSDEDNNNDDSNDDENNPTGGELAGLDGAEGDDGTGASLGVGGGDGEVGGVEDGGGSAANDTGNGVDAQTGGKGRVDGNGGLGGSDERRGGGGGLVGVEDEGSDGVDDGERSVELAVVDLVAPDAAAAETGELTAVVARAGLDTVNVIDGIGVTVLSRAVAVDGLGAEGELGDLITGLAGAAEHLEAVGVVGVLCEEVEGLLAGGGVEGAPGQAGSSIQQVEVGAVVGAVEVELGDETVGVVASGHGVAVDVLAAVVVVSPLKVGVVTADVAVVLGVDVAIEGVGVDFVVVGALETSVVGGGDTIDDSVLVGELHDEGGGEGAIDRALGVAVDLNGEGVGTDNELAELDGVAGGEHSGLGVLVDGVAVGGEVGGKVVDVDSLAVEVGGDTSSSGDGELVEGEEGDVGDGEVDSVVLDGTGEADELAGHSGGPGGVVVAGDVPGSVRGGGGVLPGGVLGMDEVGKVDVDGLGSLTEVAGGGKNGVALVVADGDETITPTIVGTILQDQLVETDGDAVGGVPGGEGAGELLVLVEELVAGAVELETVLGGGGAHAGEGHAEEDVVAAAVGDVEGDCGLGAAVGTGSADGVGAAGDGGGNTVDITSTAVEENTGGEAGVGGEAVVVDGGGGGGAELGTDVADDGVGGVGEGGDDDLGVVEGVELELTNDESVVVGVGDKELGDLESVGSVGLVLVGHVEAEGLGSVVPLDVVDGAEGIEGDAVVATLEYPGLGIVLGTIVTAHDAVLVDELGSPLLVGTLTVTGGEVGGIVVGDEGGGVEAIEQLGGLGAVAPAGAAFSGVHSPGVGDLVGIHENTEVGIEIDKVLGEAGLVGDGDGEDVVTGLEGVEVAGDGTPPRILGDGSAVGGDGGGGDLTGREVGSVDLSTIEVDDSTGSDSESVLEDLTVGEVAGSDVVGLSEVPDGLGGGGSASGIPAVVGEAGGGAGVGLPVGSGLGTNEALHASGVDEGEVDVEGLGDLVTEDQSGDGVGEGSVVEGDLQVGVGGPAAGVLVGGLDSVGGGGDTELLGGGDGAGVGGDADVLVDHLVHAVVEGPGLSATEAAGGGDLLEVDADVAAGAVGNSEGESEGALGVGGGVDGGDGVGVGGSSGGGTRDKTGVLVEGEASGKSGVDVEVGETGGVGKDADRLEVGGEGVGGLGVLEGIVETLLVAGVELDLGDFTFGLGVDVDDVDTDHVVSNLVVGKLDLVGSTTDGVDDVVLVIDTDPGVAIVGTEELPGLGITALDVVGVTDDVLGDELTTAVGEGVLVVGGNSVEVPGGLEIAIPKVGHLLTSPVVGVVGRSGTTVAAEGAVAVETEEVTLEGVGAGGSGAGGVDLNGDGNGAGGKIGDGRAAHHLVVALGGRSIGSGGGGGGGGGEVVAVDLLSVDVHDNALIDGVASEEVAGETRGAEAEGEAAGGTVVAGHTADFGEGAGSVGGPGGIRERGLSPASTALGSCGVLPGGGGGHEVAGEEGPFVTGVTIEGTGEDDGFLVVEELEGGAVGPTVVGTIDGDESVHAVDQAVLVVDNLVVQIGAIDTGNECTGGGGTLVDLEGLLVGFSLVGSLNDDFDLVAGAGEGLGNG